MIFYFLFMLVFPLTLPELNVKTSNVKVSFVYGDIGYSIFRYPREDTNRLEREGDKAKDDEKKKKEEQKVMTCKQFHATHDTPWIAIILNSDSGRLVCLGSIIDEKHILTAHRCVKHTDPSKFKILLGYYKAYWGHHSQVIGVQKAHIHPHDLVILELKKLIVFSKTVRPIKLFEGNATDAKGGGGGGGPSASGPSASAPNPSGPSATPAGRNSSTNRSPNQTLSKNREPSHLVPHSKNESSTKSPESVKPLQENPHSNNQSKVLKGDSVDFDKSVVHSRDEFTGKTIELSRITRQGNRADEQPADGKDKDEKLVDDKVEKPFSDAFKEKDVLIVGFTVKSTDAIGEPISKPLFYRMREDKIEDADQCKDHLDRPLLEDKDKEWKNRFYCIKGESKFCWGCLGGPILDPATKNQIGVIGETKPTDFCETTEVKYLALRVDIFMKWIRDNSLYI